MIANDSYLPISLLRDAARVGVTVLNCLLDKLKPNYNVDDWDKFKDVEEVTGLSTSQWCLLECTKDALAQLGVMGQRPQIINHLTLGELVVKAREGIHIQIH